MQAGKPNFDYFSTIIETSKTVILLTSRCNLVVLVIFITKNDLPSQKWSTTSAPKHLKSSNQSSYFLPLHPNAKSTSSNLKRAVVNLNFASIL